MGRVRTGSFEYGLWRKTRQFRFQAYVALAASFGRIFFANLTAETPGEFWGPRLYTVLPITLILFFVYAQLDPKDQTARDDRRLIFGSSCAYTKSNKRYGRTVPGGEVRIRPRVRRSGSAYSPMTASNIRLKAKWRVLHNPVFEENQSEHSHPTGRYRPLRLVPRSSETIAEGRPRINVVEVACARLLGAG